MGGTERGGKEDMKIKIIGIFIGMLLIFAVFVSSGMNEEIYLQSLVANSTGTHTMYVWANNDAYIDSLPGMEAENHGNEGCLKIARESGEWAYQAYTLLRFDLDDIPDDAIITQAILWMSPMEGRFAQLELLRVLELWDEDSVTWDNQPSTPSGPHIPNVNDLQMFRWDATAFVNNWWTGGYSNYGIMIVPYTTDYYYALSFHDRLDCEWTTWPRIDLTYEGSPPPDWDPPDSPDDNEVPSISISISPPNPGPGDIVHITADASDDVGLRWMRLSVTNPSLVEEWDTEELLGETSHTFSIVRQFPMGPHNVIAEVRDVSGKYNSISDSFEVVGTGTEPELTISSTPSDVWPEDGKFINVTVTASDPEGIQYLVIGVENGFFFPDSYPDHGEYILFDPPYPIEVTRKFSILNTDVPHRFDPLSHSYTEIICSAHVQDGEYLWSGIETSEVKVVRPYQWDYGLPYPNPSRNTLPWQRMYDIFGEGECWGPGSLHWWKRIVALETYGGPAENGVKYICKNGECVGMSCFSLLYAYHDTEIPNHYTHTGTVDYIHPEPFSPAYNCVQRTIERFQGAQFSDENLEVCYNQLTKQRYKTASEGIYSNFVSNQLPKIQADIELGEQGYISIKEQQKYISGGHAVVPWYIKMLDTGIWRIYVYDPNRETASLFNESNPSVVSDSFNDYYNYELYPYIDVAPMMLWFQWPNGNIWDGMIAYMPYDVALKNDYDLVKGWDYWRLVG